MRKTLPVIVALLSGLATIGCSKSGDPAAVSQPGANSGVASVSQNAGGVGAANPSTPKPPPVAANAGPDVVVSTFLDATRAGNEALATDLLTSKAREETTKEGLQLDPPGTPSMKYKIAKVEYLEDNKDAAYVNSVWTESGAGMEDSFEVVWVLRRQNDGWRIAGMAAQMQPEEPPVFLNFEDPSDVLRIKSQINQGEAETVAAPGPAASPAANPNSFDPNGFAPAAPAGQAQQPIAPQPGFQQPGFQQPPAQQPAATTAQQPGFGAPLR